jgi:hypothetical protein
MLCTTEKTNLSALGFSNLYQVWSWLFFTFFILGDKKMMAQLLTSQSGSAGINQPSLADSVYSFSELFTPQAQLLHQSLSTLGKTGQHGITCDGVTQEYCAKPGQFYPRYIPAISLIKLIFFLLHPYLPYPIYAVL